MRSGQSSSWFTQVTKWVSRKAGHAGAFAGAVALIVIWALTGPLFNFNDTWQLVINTGTTIITFLMVFLIQSTQNRDTEALQLKLDELIRAVKRARNELLDAEELTQEELDRRKAEFEKMAQQARQESLSINVTRQHKRSEIDD